MTARLIALLLLLFLIPASTGDAARLGRATCTCTPAELQKRVQDADKIYIGTVRQITEQDAMREPGREDPPVIISIDVSEGFKDAKTGTTEKLHDSLTRVTCAGHDFKENTEYLVFAYRRIAAKYEHWSLYDFKTGTYGTGGLCGGTKAITDPNIAEEIEELRRLKKSGAAVLAPTIEPQL